MMLLFGFVMGATFGLVVGMLLSILIDIFARKWMTALTKSIEKRFFTPKVLQVLAIAAVLCLATFRCEAQGTLTFASYAGATAPAGIANGPLTWKNDAGGGSVTLPYDGSGAAALTGGAYVTFAQGAGAAVGLTTYTTSYTGNLAGYTGKLLVMADDFATVTLNGVALGTTEPGQYNSVQAFDIPAGVYVSGTNTLTIAVMNTVGFAGVGFVATAVPPAVPVCAAGVTTSCTLPANAVKLGDDGVVVTILKMTAPVYFVYCVGTSCNPPAIFGLYDPFLIGPNGLFGSAFAAGAGSLYVLPGGAVQLTTAIPGPVVSIPASQ